jgi:putative ABC transport system permease protein
MRAISLAVRNVLRQKRRTILLALALAVGVMIVTLLESFTAGMELSLSGKVGALMGGEVFVSGTAATASGRAIEVLRDPERVTGLADSLGIGYRGVTLRTRAQLRLVFGHREASLGVEGVSTSTEDLSSMDLISGSRELPANGNMILLPADTAKRLQVMAGEQVIVKLTTATGQQNIGDLVVGGIIEADAILGQAKGYMDIEGLNRLLNLPAGSAQSLAFRLVSPATQDAVKSKIEKSIRAMGMAPEETEKTAGTGGGGMHGMMSSLSTLGGTATAARTGLDPSFMELRVSDLNDVTAQVSQLADTMNMMGTALFLILIAIALMGLSSTFRMVMIERTAEIGALRAMGMQRRRVLSMFLAEALVITCIGACGGTALGLASMPVLSLIPLGETGPLSFFLRSGRMAFAPGPGSILLNILLLLATGALAVFPQARRASRLAPAVALGKTT